MHSQISTCSDIWSIGRSSLQPQRTTCSIWTGGGGSFVAQNALWPICSVVTIEPLALLSAQTTHDCCGRTLLATGHSSRSAAGRQLQETGPHRRASLSVLKLTWRTPKTVFLTDVADCEDDASSALPSRSSGFALRTLEVHSLAPSRTQTVQWIVSCLEFV